LIGVYLDKLIPSALPANMVLSLWVRFTPKETGRKEAQLRVLLDKKKVLGGKFVIEFAGGEAGALTIPRLPLQLPSPGTLKFELNFGSGWNQITSLRVTEADPTLASTPSS
jgi:hypothetical protein